MSAQRQFAIDVVTQLRAAGFQALWAGGCVRDQILGFTPKDYDVATNAVPEQIRVVFGRRRTLPIGQAFGVITVLGPKQAGQIEVATFRSDASYSDGRHPDSVTFSTAEADAQRRDFTINGLFYDPLEEEVIDFVGGLADLQRRVVRAIGDPFARISEDKLRMLRAVRIAATFGFEIDGETFSAIQKQANEIVIVSAERIVGELRRMLIHHNRTTALELLRNAGLLEVIVPETSDGFATGDPVDDQRRWLETISVLRNLREPTFSAAFAGLLHRCLGPQAGQSTGVRNICKRLKMTNMELDGVQFLLANAATIRNARGTSWPTLQRLLTQRRVSELLGYAEALAAVYDDNTEEIEFCLRKLALPKSELNPPPLIDGKDLIALGLRPGPKFRAILSELRDDQLNGEITTHGAGLRRAKLAIARNLSDENDLGNEEKKTR